MSQYAENTTVTADRSRAEIEKVLSRYGADQFMYGWDNSQAVIQFRADGRHIRFILAMPEKDDREFTHTPARNTRRSDDQIHKAWEQSTRQRWRALALVIKAKLEAVESGITEFEAEFLAHVVLPNGQTVGEMVRPSVENAYLTGDMPKALPW